MKDDRFAGQVTASQCAPWGRSSRSFSVATPTWEKNSSATSRWFARKVKIDIAYRERAVTDEHLVAKNFSDFEKTIADISFDEQGDLLRLLLSQVRVHLQDTKNEPVP
jgi:hypothetical protein